MDAPVSDNDAEDEEPDGIVLEAAPPYDGAADVVWRKIADWSGADYSGLDT